MTGRASWRPDGTVAWSRATVNLPLRQGAEVWLPAGSRMELQFDDGSTMRLGDGAVATLQSLYSDDQGEFTEVKLQAGTSSWHLRDKYSLFQVDTPDDSVKAVGPSEFRVDVTPRADSLAVRKGTVTLTADGRDTPIDEGHYTVLRSADDPVVIHRLTSEDPWDRFSDSRDVVLDEAPAHVPANIALVSGGLDRHGHWHFEAGYGWVWTPVVEAGWRPYHRGHWTWVDPFGWTWVSDDPWGWAPYHYGTWAHFGTGWGWCPGPAVQYWSPAAVDFVDDDGYIAWAPLAPTEVRYPTFSVGFGGPNWWLSFSIGGCAVYEPFATTYCDPVVYPAYCFAPGWRRHGWDRDGWDRGDFGRNGYHFVPRNAAFGAIAVSRNGFAGSGRYVAINRNSRSMFAKRAQLTGSRTAFSGPVNVRPGVTAFTPNRTLAGGGRPTAMNRSVYRAPLTGRLARMNATSRAQPVSALHAAAMGASRARIARASNSAPSSLLAARQSIGFHGRTRAYTSRGAPGQLRPLVGGRNVGTVRSAQAGFSRALANNSRSSGAGSAGRGRASVGQRFQATRRTVATMGRGNQGRQLGTGQRGQADTFRPGRRTGQANSLRQRSNPGSGPTYRQGRSSMDRTRQSNLTRSQGPFRRDAMQRSNQQAGFGRQQSSGRGDRGGGHQNSGSRQPTRGGSGGGNNRDRRGRG